jgi:hypothetical protein
LFQTNRQYCEWAVTEIRNYYNRLLILEEENEWVNFRTQGDEIPWTLDELSDWITLKEAYNGRI